MMGASLAVSGASPDMPASVPHPLGPVRAIACPADGNRRLLIDVDRGVQVDELVCAPASSRAAAEAVVAYHYMHRRPTISHAFGIWDRNKVLQGVITYGTPASRQLQKSVCPTDPGRVVELNRMWIDDALPHGIATWFISRTLKTLPAHIVVSYADTIQNHMGYVYRAANFHYAGWTDMERQTPRYDYIPLHPGAHTREAFRSGYGARVRRKPKVKYWTVTGCPTDKKVLRGLCGWPVMDWKTEPPPREHRQRGWLAAASGNGATA